MEQFAEILGIAVDSSDDEIHRAYRKLASEHHPDLGGDKERFQEIQSAYERLLMLRKKAAARARQADLESRKKHQKANQASTSETSTSQPAATHPENRMKPSSGSSSSVPASRSKSATQNKKSNNAPNQNSAGLFGFLFRKLPLQDETTTFILINVLDIFMTYLLMTMGAIEANPFANYFFERFNFNGMIFFKLVIVAAVCLISQIVAIQSIQKARFLLLTGNVLVGAVVVYSVWLYFTKFY